MSSSRARRKEKAKEMKKEDDDQKSRFIKSLIDEITQTSIAAGSFATIHKNEKHNVVIKKIPLKHSLHYKAEKEVFEKLKPHKNIATIIGTHTDKDGYYIVVRYYPTSLKSLIEEEKIEMNQVTEIALGMAEGLQHLHSYQYVHCDVKPDNVMLDKDNCVKLIDFGGTTKLGNSTNAATPGYFLDEKGSRHQNNQRGIAKAEQDLYAYGMTLLQVLSDAVSLTVNLRRGQTSSLVEYVMDKKPEQYVANRMWKEDSKMAEKIANIAMRCLRLNPELRKLNLQAIQLDEIIDELKKAKA